MGKAVLSSMTARAKEPLRRAKAAPPVASSSSASAQPPSNRVRARRLAIAASQNLGASECQRCPVRSTSPLQLACFADLQKIHVKTQQRVHPRGDLVLREFGNSTGLLCIGAGLLLVREVDRNGVITAVHTASTGEMVGLDASFANISSGRQVSALTDATVCHIPREALLAASETTNLVARGVLEALAHRCVKVSREFSAVQRRSASGRVLAVVLGLRGQFGRLLPGGGLRIVLPLSKADLADLAGITPATLSRTIASLKQSGIAAFDGRQVTIADLDHALDIVEGVIEGR